jgi:hypothetical protein
MKEALVSFGKIPTPAGWEAGVPTVITKSTNDLRCGMQLCRFVKLLKVLTYENKMY